MVNNPEVNHPTPSGQAVTGDFDLLQPQVVLAAAEAGFGLRLDGSMTPYNSYINRVYELKREDGKSYMAKFYRPGRWSFQAIQEEHAFLHDCAQNDIPVVEPLPDPDGDSLLEVQSAGETEQSYLFALFPKRAGRNFDAESDQDWLRLGSLVGRMHLAARSSNPTPLSASCRPVCLPRPIITTCLQELDQAGALHPDVSSEFINLADTILQRIEPLFTDVPLQRVHGDCHRGNILERPGEGLLLIDFDDMMIGPAIQDIWLLLPERADQCNHELNLIAEGYEQFLPFDYSWKRLIEPLRAMRMLYYLAWQARQRHDRKFQSDYPDWGSRAFWIKEVEDLREQLQYCE